MRGAHERLASLDEPEEGDVAWMAYVLRAQSSIDGTVELESDENPPTAWYGSQQEAMSKAVDELVGGNLEVEWHNDLSPERTLIPWMESWLSTIFVTRCEWDGYDWVPDDDYDEIDIPVQSDYTEPYKVRDMVVSELEKMLPAGCRIDLSWAPMSYETFYVMYGSFKARISGHDPNDDYGPCDLYLDVEDYPLSYNGVFKLASELAAEIELYADDVRSMDEQEAEDSGLWLPREAGYRAVGYCARCGAYDEVDVASWLCDARDGRFF